MLMSGWRTALRFPVAQGDMRQLPVRSGAFAAAVAFYSIHNVTRAEFDSVIVELARVLEPGGTLLAATHLGEGEVYSDRFLGHHIAATGGTLYSPEEVMGLMSSKRFAIKSTEVRDPLAHEHQTRRIYVLATRTD
jgi:ubiquinone/menaquinone biosynthesis C-methylase UbiE